MSSWGWQANSFINNPLDTCKMLTFLRFRAGADADLIAQFSLEPLWTWTLPLGGQRKCVFWLERVGVARQHWGQMPLLRSFWASAEHCIGESDQIGKWGGPHWDTSKMSLYVRGGLGRATTWATLEALSAQPRRCSHERGRKFQRSLLFWQ